MLRGLAERIVAPLRLDDGPNKFRLSAPDTHTTTIDGDTGWTNRPPASLECPKCTAEIRQRDPRASIDCPSCVAEFDYDDFAELEVLFFECPVCRNRMRHGRRHPGAIEIPEWATCDRCRYHWEFKHTY